MSPGTLAGVLLAASTISLSALHAQSPPAAEGADTPPAATAAPASTPPQVDGRLDEAAWREAPALSGFVQREPFEGRPATEATEVRVLYDRDALYIGAWLYDRDPAGIIVGEARRDTELSDSDALLIVLDTYRDQQNGFVFGTNPAGIEYDGQVTREGQGSGGGGGGGFGGGGQMRQQAGSGGGLNKNWDGSWTVATSRDEHGWYAEFRIPFSTLRYGGGGQQTWGLNFARRIRRKNEEALWSAVPRQFDLYRLSHAGTLTGFEAPTRRTWSLTPYVLASGRNEYGAVRSSELDGSVGGDAKIGLTPSLTLDLTLNTDFAQVEVDEQQINLTRYQLFFPEKRPFFLENAGTFSLGTPQQVEIFFSRRIGIENGRAVPILGGGRLTGKAAGLSLGLLSIQTGGEELDAAPDGTPQQAHGNNFSVARVIRELPNRSRVGAMLTSRVSAGDLADYNLAYAVDGRLGIGGALTLDAYAARTETPGLDAPAHAYSLGGTYTTRDWRLVGSFREVARGFNPETGFLTRSDYRAVSARIQRNLRFSSLPWFRELRPHIQYNENLDLDGFTESRLIHIDSHFEFSNGAFFQLPAINLTREGLRTPFRIARGVTIPAGTYDNVDWGFAYYTNRSAPVSLQGRIDIGGFYGGFRKGAATTLDARLSETLVTGLRVSYYDVDLPEGSFTRALVGLRAAYSFTPRVYLQSLIQYNDETKSLSSNIRFGWLNTAGTGLFLVYNDLSGADLFERPTPRPLERALVVKFTRQWSPGG